MWMPEDYVDFLWLHLGNKLSDEWNDNKLLKIGGTLTKQYVCWKRMLSEAWVGFVTEATEQKLNMVRAHLWQSKILLYKTKLTQLILSDLLWFHGLPATPTWMYRLMW
jgi:hypothetical protein